jgi:hypothetical protein
VLWFRDFFDKNISRRSKTRQDLGQNLMLTGLEPKTNIAVPVNTQREAVEEQL